MLIYNTLARRKEEFVPINPPEVKMYVCGPTVYDFFHIGNARSFIMADMIRKYLEYKSYRVKFVMNITDVDDKIIKKSLQENKQMGEISRFYSEAFLNDSRKLKIKEADIFPRATENIPEIIDIIKKLIENNHAYEVDGDVFYNVHSFSHYGKLSGKNLDELESGARVEVDIRKKSPLDFALWKKAKDGEPCWDSPWGAGRPGWHVECSAMSMKYLGIPIDIHAGGSDLIFPHHENEIAQSEAATGQKFVNYWLHFGFLNIQNEKMSKSLGNFFTAREILSKYNSETIRLFFCQTHYAGPLNFSDDLLSAAQKGLEKIKNAVIKIEEGIKQASGSQYMPELDIQKYKSDFETAMDDDFNSPKAVAVIFDFIRDFNKVGAESGNINPEFFIKAKEFLINTAQNVLGILDLSDLGGNKNDSLIDELINILINIRLKAKTEKNYKLSDEIRNELKNIGIMLEDKKDSTSYKIVKSENN